MSGILKINDQIVDNEELLRLLKEYRMLPQLAKEVITEQTIAHIDLSVEEKADLLQQFYQQNQITTEQDMQKWLTQQGLTLEQLQKLIFKKPRLDKYKEETWSNQVENYFLKRKGQLDQVIYSLIRTQDAGVAQELYFRVQENEKSFSELAVEYSQGQEAQTGGLLGPVEISTPHPTIGQMLAVSKPRQLWSPVRIGQWWVIVRLEKFIRVKLDEQIRQRMLDELFQTWLEEEVAKKLVILPVTEAPLSQSLIVPTI